MASGSANLSFSYLKKGGDYRMLHDEIVGSVLRLGEVAPNWLQQVHYYMVPSSLVRSLQPPTSWRLWVQHRVDRLYPALVVSAQPTDRGFRAGAYLYMRCSVYGVRICLCSSTGASSVGRRLSTESIYWLMDTVMAWGQPERAAAVINELAGWMEATVTHLPQRGYEYWVSRLNPSVVTYLQAYTVGSQGGQMVGELTFPMLLLYGAWCRLQQVAAANPSLEAVIPLSRYRQLQCVGGATWVVVDGSRYLVRSDADSVARAVEEFWASLPSNQRTPAVLATVVGAMMAVANGGGGG